MTDIISSNLLCELASSSLYAPGSLVRSGDDVGRILRVLVPLCNDVGAGYEKISLRAKKSPDRERETKETAVLK